MADDIKKGGIWDRRHQEGRYGADNIKRAGGGRVWGQTTSRGEVWGRPQQEGRDVWGQTTSRGPGGMGQTTSRGPGGMGKTTSRGPGGIGAENFKRKGQHKHQRRGTEMVESIRKRKQRHKR